MGFPRSGTTGLASGLAHLDGFPDYSSEGHFIYLFKEAIERILNNQVNSNCLLRDEQAKNAFLGTIATGIDNAYRAKSDSAPLNWIDKTPDIAQVQAAGIILRLFPEAKFLFIYRDPLSAVRSNLATWPSQLQGKHLEVARRWADCHKAWRHVREQIPQSQRAEIFQPTLRLDPAAVVQKILPLLELSHEELRNLTSFWESNRTVNRPNSGEHAKKYDQIQLSPDVERVILEECSPELEHWPEMKKELKC